MQIRENPPYKRGCPKIGLDRRGGMNQNTPNPRLALRWPHPCSLPIEWGRWGCPLNNPKPRWYWTPGVAAGKGQRWEKLPLEVTLWLTPEESAGQRLWRGQRIDNRLRVNQVGETRGYRHSHHQSPHVFSGIFACGSGGSPGYGGWPLIKINSFHNNIWFDYLDLKHH